MERAISITFDLDTCINGRRCSTREERSAFGELGSSADSSEAFGAIWRCWPSIEINVHSGSPYEGREHRNDHSGSTSRARADEGNLSIAASGVNRFR